MTGVTQACDEAGLRLTVVFTRTYCCCVFGQMPDRAVPQAKEGSHDDSL
jgi:hypothetical protein